jgi:hypothetical protein
MHIQIDQSGRIENLTQELEKNQGHILLLTEFIKSRQAQIRLLK